MVRRHFDDLDTVLEFGALDDFRLNRAPDGNPLGLLPAGELYVNPVYGRLVGRSLDGFVEQVASSGAGDAIALGYLYLIRGQLERVRFRSERGYEDSARLIEEFQRAVADLAVTGRVDAQALSMVTSVLHMAGIEASAELRAGVTQFTENVLPLAAPPDFTDAMADMVAECEGDPFQLAGALAEAGHAIPAEARILMAAFSGRAKHA